jgi:hypothetical protein
VEGGEEVGEGREDEGQKCKGVGDGDGLEV